MTLPKAAVLPIRGLVVLPGMLQVFVVGRPSSVKALDHHVDEGVELVLVPQRDVDHEDPVTADVAGIGVLAQVLRVTRMPDGTSRVLAEGLARVSLHGDIEDSEQGTRVGVSMAEPPDEDPIETAALARQVSGLFQEYMLNAGIHAQEHAVLAAPTDDPSRLADQIGGVIDMDLDKRIGLLEQLSVKARLDTLVQVLAVALAQQRIAGDVAGKVQAAMDKQQRDYHLREQLKIIRTELGDAAGGEAEADKYEQRIETAGMPETVAAEARREANRLRRIQVDSAEYAIARTWLDMVCELPWSVATTDRTDLKVALKTLDADHYGLDKVKERILEYLAVRQLQPESKGAILCFVGPPGVGKTSLGRSIARALERNFQRIALGGIKDETEVRGHRRTYIGALPGRIMRAVHRARSRNPVIVLDELDKVGSDVRGDPASALLEVLDPEQNDAFVDHYLDLPFDLSQVMFIGTANRIDTIPPALIDRLELIELPGYTEEDKLEIAQRFLIPKQRANNGVSGKQLSISVKAIQATIRDYTREAGVRELERQLAGVHRKVARMVVEGRTKKVRISDSSLSKFLGPPKYFRELAERVDQPGVVVGLAWTAVGGDILFIEAARMPGKPSLKLTGSLGSVMKESAEAAMSWLRANALSYGVAAEAFEAEFHLHVPAGAIPKDGPSAGVTMATALTSVVTGRAVKARVAMTGEITLRGKVLPVGGVKEKVLAARRAGVKEVILPARNRTDLDDVPAVLRNDLVYHFVEDIGEVLDIALNGSS